MSLLCAPGTWDAGKAALEELEEHSGASWGPQLVDLGWSSGSARLRAMELMIAAVPEGITGERVPYYMYCDPFCFEICQMGFLTGLPLYPSQESSQKLERCKAWCKDTGLLPLCSRVCVLKVFPLSGCSHPPLSWTMERWLSLLMLGWRLYQVVSDQAKNKVFRCFLLGCSMFRTFMEKIERADNPVPDSAAKSIYPWITAFFPKTNVLSLRYLLSL